MNNKIFSIYDVKAQAYINPFFLPKVAIAIRSFVDCVYDPNHQFGKNPQDYTLFTLGEFNIETGEFEIHESPVHVITGLEARAAAIAEEERQMLMFPQPEKTETKEEEPA
jgi:hypothetical protein